MGDRGSITVVNSLILEGPQPVLFRHWGGNEASMEKLVKRLRETLPEETHIDPYTRREPSSCMALLVKLAVETDGYSAYVGRSREDGDNSDNGHFVLDLADFSLKREDVGQE